MFESNKGMVLRECDRLNETRGVMTGSVSHTTFFHRIQGDLLISGYLASNLSLITDLVLEYLCRKDMPTILLSCPPFRIRLNESTSPSMDWEKRNSFTLSIVQRSCWDITP